MKKKEMKTAKEYAFRFDGSKEQFMNVLNSSQEDDRRYFYIDDYIVSVGLDEIEFGVERAGHGGGNWFVSKFEEENDQIEFRGTIRYYTPEDNRTKARKASDKFLLVLFEILTFPLLLVICIFGAVSTIINKMRKKPKPLTTEEKLFDLMVNRLGCKRI